LREAQHRARNTVQVILSLLNLYGRAVPPEAAGLFGSLTQRIRALGIVAGSLPEGPQHAVVDLTDYLQQIARQLAGVYGAEGSVTVEGARAELEPARAHAVGTVVAELLGSFLRPAERRREGVAVAVGAAENGAIRVAIRGEAADEQAPAKLGERLTTAYATRAGIELARAEGLVELTVPLA
jgi:two-component sensor histidine kinase